MIKLEDFVAETIGQIVQGVRRSHLEAAKVGARVNPRTPNDFILSPQPIEFDVAVTASEGAETQGGVGVFVGPVALGSKGKSDSANTTVSRIKFTVPVELPEQN